MSTPLSMNDLRRRFFGGGSDAERAFLEDAAEKGLTAAAPNQALSTVWIDAGVMFPATTGQFPDYGQLGLQYDPDTEEKAAMKFRPPAVWGTMDMYIHSYSSNATSGGVRWLFTDVMGVDHAATVQHAAFEAPTYDGFRRTLLAEDVAIMSNPMFGELGVQQGPVYRKVDHNDDTLAGDCVLWGIELVRKG